MATLAEYSTSPCGWGVAEGSGQSRCSRARRGDGARLRQELLAAAGHLLDARGENAVTVRAVVGEVGCTAPSLYLHFFTRGNSSKL
ncbi:TetR/AcrR family transcriptional regulator [Streptomyces misionensis]|uniref:TetR/AcrR family transcriptional regulator n=1 Tax=Streptomyces misionensis TaxID=67331 RepID=UPI0033C113EA